MQHDSSEMNNELEVSFNVKEFMILDDVKNIKKDFISLDTIDSLENRTTHTFLFDVNKYLKDILQSYSNDPEKIIEQVQVDYCRTNVYLNNHKVPTINKFISDNDRFINKVFSVKLNDKYETKEYNFLVILLMLCCQSSYGLHYMTLRDIYCENVEELLLCSSGENRHTSFIINNDVLTITIETNLIIKNITNNTIVKKINTSIIIDSYLNDGSGSLIQFNEFGLFYWMIK